MIASGIHTTAIFQRLAVTGAYQNWAVIAGRRITGIELPAPVTAGLELTGTLEVLDVEHRRPDRSLVRARGELSAATGPVMLKTLELYLRRRA